MTATVDRVRVWFYSEKLLAGFGGQPPYKGCGIATDANMTGLATFLGSATTSTGRLKSKAARTNDLKRGWRAFTKVADSNGIPDTGDALRIHEAMFPGTPNPAQFTTRNFDDIIDRMDQDFAISIALRLSVLGASNPIDLTTADHQVGIFRRRGDKVRVVGPMHDHSDRYSGHMAPLYKIKKAALAIEDGLILTWLYPIGGWTQEGELRARVRDLRASAAADDKTIDTQKERIEALKTRVSELERMGGCEDEVAADRNDLLDSLDAWSRDRR